MSRRKVLTWGLGALGAVLAAGAGGFELVEHGVLPGKARLDQALGGCDVTVPTLSFRPVGAAYSGGFPSQARGQHVGYTIALPPRTAAPPSGSTLPLVVVLHGFGGNNTNAVAGMTPAQALALPGIAPMALVTVDGGGGYWHAHPGDDPMAMLVNELIPLCQGQGLGAPPSRIGVLGISMGGYGALLLAEKHPSLVSCVAAISPAVWTSYSQARGANAGAFASAADFAANDVIAGAAALAGVPTRIASGNDDPFHPGVLALSKVVPRGTVVDFTNGCHTGDFFTSQEPASMAFLSAHLG